MPTLPASLSSSLGLLLGLLHLLLNLLLGLHGLLHVQLLLHGLADSGLLMHLNVLILGRWFLANLQLLTLLGLRKLAGVWLRLRAET